MRPDETHGDAGAVVAPPAPPTLRPHPNVGSGRVARPDERVLRNRAFSISRIQSVGLAAAIVVPAIVLLAVAHGVLEGQEGNEGFEEGAAWQALGRAIVDALAEDAFQLALGLVSVGVSALVFVGGVRERVFIGTAGIRYRSGWPAWLGPLDRSFDVSADEIVDLRTSPFRIGGGPVLTQLEIVTRAATHRLSVFQYVDPEGYVPGDFRVLAGFRQDVETLGPLFEMLPLVVWARERGFALELPEPGAALDSGQVSVKEKPRVALTVALIVGLFGYAAFDLGAVPETYAAGTPLGWLLAGGLLGAAGGWLMLGDREVTPGMRGVLAGALALAVMGALLPGLVRINRLDTSPLETHVYRHTERATVAPVDPSSPHVDLVDPEEIWPGSVPGDVHEIRLRRGWLGFWQLEIDSLHRGSGHDGPRRGPKISPDEAEIE